MSKPEIYISIDIEASGPIPGEYSMLSFGACFVERTEMTFHRRLRPISDKFIPGALAVTGMTLESADRTGIGAEQAMREFAAWVEDSAGEGLPVFVGFNASFDWSFINWYFHRYLGRNPFGIGGLDIKAFYMGFAGCEWQETTSRQLPVQFQPSTQQTHHALDDALAQAEIFRKLLAASQGKERVRR
jgi:ribonuclease T